MDVWPKVILGLIIPGVGLTIAVLVLYARAAWHEPSRRHLDRVSFRLLVYALLAHLVYGIVFPIGTLAAHPGWRCNLLSFLTNLSLMFSAGMFFCIALNLLLVLAHKVNGQKMEKYYVVGTAFVSIVCSVVPYASGRFGYNINQTCWYRTADTGTTLRWLVGTQTFWMLLISAGEVLAFWTIMGYLIAYELFTRRFRSNNIVTNSSETTGSTILMFRSIILRIGLYPLVSCLLNISVSVLDLYEMRHPERTDLTLRLDLTDLAIYSARPLIYGILAATDPSFIRALCELRRPSSTHSRSQQPCLSGQWAHPCLSTVIEIDAAELEGAVKDERASEGERTAVTCAGGEGEGEGEEYQEHERGKGSHDHDEGAGKESRADVGKEYRPEVADPKASPPMPMDVVCHI
ncbi:hypothetical protein C8R44DRAFT_22389 [Mycena epipterygia]|nr:hypothetical protein C8R44DRAFT_22389 [Mycena epipterygia]